MRLFLIFVSVLLPFNHCFCERIRGISVNLINLRLKRVEFVEIRLLLQLQNISNH